MIATRKSIGLCVFIFVAVISGVLLFYKTNAEPNIEYGNVTVEQSGGNAEDGRGNRVEMTATTAGVELNNHYSSTSLLTTLRDELIQEVSQKTTAMLENPPHPGRASLQSQMRQETPKETFLRLSDNDNLAMLMPVMAGHPFSPGRYRSDIQAMTKMTRIRKLIEDTLKNPSQMVPFLQEQLSSIAEKFPRVYKEFEESMRNDQTEGMHKFDELPEMMKDRLLSTAAVYVLTEANAVDALPTLAKLSAVGAPGRAPDLAGTGPVNRKFLAYAMHKLIRKVPEATLSAEAAEIRHNYLSWAESLGVGAGKQVKVTSWSVLYHEDDYRRTILRRKLPMDEQSTMELEVFPVLKELRTDDVERLLKQQREFIDLVR